VSFDTFVSPATILITPSPNHFSTYHKEEEEEEEE